MRLGLRIRTSVATAATALLAIAAPVAGASAATTPAASGAPSLQPPAFTFVPPTVGPLSVDIGKTIINGQVTDPGLHVLMPPITMPPMNWSPRG
ncbi:MAG: hypothetical protein JWO02_720 [Solirubrobacterales bacterium]|nr:hypothetical protein [Solirubrobacterales bacterium]